METEMHQQDFNTMIQNILAVTISNGLDEINTRLSDKGYTVHISVTKDE